MFHSYFDDGLVGVAPYMVSIDGGYAQTEYTGFDYNAILTLGYAQTEYTGFHYNGESDLDLEYGMNLVTAKQQVTLYQVGDMIEGASFNNFLDAIDGTYCTYDGG
ncbi:hypothetical protein AZE42_13609, partial [Rhizopogon vesiculosus]